MSWSLRTENVTDAPAGNAAKVINALQLEWKAGAEVVAETEAQVAAAKAAAIALSASGTVGVGPWNVTLNGHARPGHAESPNWSSPDGITVSVTGVYQHPQHPGHGQSS